MDGARTLPPSAGSNRSTRFAAKERVLTAFARAGFTDVVLDPIDDQYQPNNPDGESVSLDLYIVRGRAPGNPMERMKER